MWDWNCALFFSSAYGMLCECTGNVIKETILAECPGMIKRNETDSEYETIRMFY